MVGLLLFVPTIYWVHLKVPRLRPVVGFMALIPFVDPADHPRRRPAQASSRTRCTRRSGSSASPTCFLVGAYVILAFPYIYFSLDAGFRSIDVHTLTEASQSLGASLAQRRSGA